MATGPKQLALSLDHQARLSRDDFLEGPSNAAALAMIERWPDWPAHAIAITGPEGSGKSHLAAIWAQASGAQIVRARSLKAEAVPDALSAGALVLEDCDSGECEDRTLFHLLNLVRETAPSLLITGPAAPAHWPVRLPDLVSRLRSIPIAALSMPDDALLRAVMVKLFADRQLAVDEALIAYLALRVERTFASVRKAVDNLDKAALQRGRPVTRALAVELFREAGR